MDITLRKARENKQLSLREAAKKLGISHAYLSGIELGHKPLQNKIAHKMAELYSVNLTKLAQPLPEDKEKFLDWLTAQIRWWDSRFIMPQVSSVTRLIEDIYVEPTLVEANTVYESSDLFLKDVLLDHNNTPVILCGELGTGKSTFLKKVTIDSKSLQKRLELDNKFIPFLVSLGQFTLQQGSLVKDLALYYEQCGYSGSITQLEVFIRQCIERGQAIFLFDGLDEINNQSLRADFFARLEIEIKNKLQRHGNKVIISSQPDILLKPCTNSPDYKFVSIEPWNDSQLLAASERWLWELSESGKNFWIMLQGNEALHTIARWPLLFHLLTTLRTSLGIYPFQELHILYNECCKVLEHNWHRARKALFVEKVEANSASLARHAPWLKWRQFLVFFMEQVLKTWDTQEDSLPYEYSSQMLQDAWDDFLESKGFARSSIDFDKLDELFENQASIGPMVRFQSKDRRGRIQYSYRFLEKNFAHFYFAKALLNKPDELKEFFLQNLRNPALYDVIPLIIQELGGSERSFENKFGKELLQIVHDSDDELKLSSTKDLIPTGQYIAFRSVVSFNVINWWDSIILPVLQRYLRSNYQRDMHKIFKILGEQSAVEEVREHFNNLFETLDEAQPNKWRLRSILARYGEKIDETIQGLEAVLSRFLSKKSTTTVADRIEARRTIWSIGQIGHLFVQEEQAGQASIKHSSIKRIDKTLSDFTHFICTSITSEISNKTAQSHELWHLALRLIFTQSRLQYSDNVKVLVNNICNTVSNNFELCFFEYKDSYLLTQFLKSAFVHKHLLDKQVKNNLIEQLEKYSEQEINEHSLLLTMLKLEQLPTDRKERHQLYRTLSLSNDQLPIKTWIKTISNSKNTTSKNLLEFASAICGVSEFYRDVMKIEGKNSVKELIKTLTKTLATEEALEQGVREEQRIFTYPLTDYGGPVYDHIYDAIEKLSRLLPLAPNSSS